VISFAVFSDVRPRIIKGDGDWFLVNEKSYSISAGKRLLKAVKQVITRHPAFSFHNKNDT
jgi:hypothetical protein